MKKSKVVGLGSWSDQDSDPKSISGAKAQKPPGLNCKTQRFDLAGWVRLRKQFNPMLL
jgi:hypothetical protein